MSATNAEVTAIYGALDEARRQQILDYQQECAEAEQAKQQAQGSA